MVSTLKEIAEITQGEMVGEDLPISGAAGIHEVAPGEITFAENERTLLAAERTEAAAIIAPPDARSSQKPLIKVGNPRLAFSKVLSLFYPPEEYEPGIHPTAILGRSVQVGEGSSVGPYTVIQDSTRLGCKVRIGALCFIGKEVEIGDGTVIHPRVSIMSGVFVGRRCIIHSGAVIGADGFGYARDGTVHTKIPQVGRVRLDDDVEIGANTTIDRATTGVTRIGRGTKIDNLVQVGHNAYIGEDCIIVSQAGLAGSVRIGDRVILAAQAGIRDHVEVGSDAIVGGQAGVTKSVPPKTVVSGYPARPHRHELRIEALVEDLPNLVKKVANFEKILQQVREGER